MIAVNDLVVRYGSAVAIDGVSLTVAAGERVALIGSNGAGKSTLLDALSGIARPSAGTIRVGGRFAHVPEGRQLFPDLTVEDNLRLGAFRSGDRDTSWVYELLPELARTRKQRAHTLSGGQQQMVAIARGLMSRPDVMAVDELSLGLAPKVTSHLAGHLLRLSAERRLGLLLVEQSARLAFSVCARAYVLEAGRVVAHGPSEELRRNPLVVDAYLGGRSDERP